ncbi:hypothetical protein [Streptomyces cinereospinus]|uniref:HAD-IIIA family hydrolase n=1 Tax=Streptomyces cinereospinus TaxID=285561 RepID=A0ABV5MX90_9ACTN
MSRIRVVLLDRDGVLVEDVPDNADPDRVRPVAGAREALALLRAHDVRTGFLTRQPGVAGGRLTEADVRRVDARVEDSSAPSTCAGCARTPPRTAAAAARPSRA